MNIEEAINRPDGFAKLPVARRPIAIFGAVMVVLLIVFCAAQAIQGWLQLNEDTQTELASNAELDARALDSYFSKLDSSLRVMTEAIGTDVEPDELDSPEFKVRASNVLTQFYQFQSNIANVTLVKANGQ